jgi:phosphoglycolate phosphatase
MIKLAMFDLDGTLVDSIHDISISANQAIQKHGRPAVSTEKIKEYIGDGLTTFVKGLSGDLFHDEAFIKTMLADFATHYDTQLVENTKFYPGAEIFMKSFLESHPERRIGVITNKPEGQARVILRHLGYKDDYFVQIFGGDTFEVKKPHPKPLNEMLKLASLKPEEALMIGDSRQDYEAAKSAGTHFMAVSFGYNTKEKLMALGIEQFIDHFSELHGKIENLI